MKRIFVIFTMLVICMSSTVFAGGSASKGSAAPESAEPAKATVMVYEGNFVQIPGGSFTMGGGHLYGTEPRKDPWPEVTVSTFYMAVLQVTQREYEAVMGKNPSFGGGPDWAVEGVSWFEALEYCNTVSRREGLTPAYTINGENVTWNRSANGYRLPTDAEWEYAAKAPGVQWTNPDHPWGLRQMPGDYWEWAWDWYDTIPAGTFTDPDGPASGKHRVMRGGPYAVCEPRGVAITMRDHDFPVNGSFHFGFRVVRSSM